MQIKEIIKRATELRNKFKAEQELRKNEKEYIHNYNPVCTLLDPVEPFVGGDDIKLILIGPRPDRKKN